MVLKQQSNRHVGLDIYVALEAEWFMDLISFIQWNTPRNRDGHLDMIHFFKNYNLDT